MNRENDQDGQGVGPGADGGEHASEQRESRTETTLTTRVRVSIPGSRPMPPMVLRQPVPGQADDEAAPPVPEPTGGGTPLPKRTPRTPHWKAVGPVDGSGGNPAQPAAASGQSAPPGEEGGVSDWFRPRRPTGDTGSHPRPTLPPPPEQPAAPAPAPEPASSPEGGTARGTGLLAGGFMAMRHGQDRAARGEERPEPTSEFPLPRLDGEAPAAAQPAPAPEFPQSAGEFPAPAGPAFPDPSTGGFPIPDEATGAYPAPESPTGGFPAPRIGEEPAPGFPQQPFPDVAPGPFDAPAGPGADEAPAGFPGLGGPFAEGGPLPSRPGALDRTSEFPEPQPDVDAPAPGAGAASPFFDSQTPGAAAPQQPPFPGAPGPFDGPGATPPGGSPQLGGPFDGPGGTPPGGTPQAAGPFAEQPQPQPQPQPPVPPQGGGTPSFPVPPQPARAFGEDGPGATPPGGTPQPGLPPRRVDVPPAAGAPGTPAGPGTPNLLGGPGLPGAPQPRPGGPAVPPAGGTAPDVPASTAAFFESQQPGATRPGPAATPAGGPGKKPGGNPENTEPFSVPADLAGEGAPTAPAPDGGRQRPQPPLPQPQQAGAPLSQTPLSPGTGRPGDGAPTPGQPAVPDGLFRPEPGAAPAPAPGAGPGQPPVPQPVPQVRPEPAAPAPAAATTGRRGGGRNKLVLAAGGIVGLVAVAYVVGLAVDHGDVPNGTTVLGTDIGGMDRAAAQAKLNSAVGPRATAPLKLTANGKQFTLMPSVAGLGLDTTKTVRSVAHKDYNPVSVIGSLFGRGRTAQPVLVEDREKLNSQLAKVAGKTGGTLQEGGIRFTRGEAVAVTPHGGTSLDPAASGDAVIAAWRQRMAGGADKPVGLTLKQQTPKVSSAEVQRAMKEFAKPAMSGLVTLQAGGIQIQFSPATLSKGGLLQMKPDAQGKLRPVWNTALLEKTWGHTFDQLGPKPTPPGYTKSGSTVVIKPHTGLTGAAGGAALDTALVKTVNRIAVVKTG